MEFVPGARRKPEPEVMTTDNDLCKLNLAGDAAATVRPNVSTRALLQMHGSRESVFRSAGKAIQQLKVADQSVFQTLVSGP